MIDLHIFEFPLSLILASALAACILILRNCKTVKYLKSRRLAIILLLISSAFLAVEGTWNPILYHHWSFVTVMVIAVMSLGIISLHNFSKKYIYSFLNHAGLFLVIFGGLFGAPDCTDHYVKDYREGGISLEDFNIEYYGDGTSVKQYSSKLSIDGNQLVTSVNHPCRYKGYWIYQTGYDASDCRYPILRIVRDPWLPVVALGALLLLTGAYLSLKTVWRSRKVTVAALSLAVVFALVSVARINFGTLPPALRSVWFLPHLSAYMLAYSILALAVISGIATQFSTRIPGGLPDKLLTTASSLLLVGMIIGAIWAKQAWGDYWTWDPKECWAAATWVMTLAATHSSKEKTRQAFAVVAFLFMQMTWYGVNYLPSSGLSLHTYMNP